MKLHLKKIQDQVIAVIGASSGMGLKVAQLAAKKGAKVLLVARNEEALQDAVVEIKNLGGEAIYSVADVTNYDQLQAAADSCIREYGRIDSWVHIAGIGHWGFAEDIKIEEARSIFDINFWGLVYGSRIAMQRMREQGGAIIHMGSVESERAIPYHSFYAASKHAIKAYTEAVRVESEKRNLPLSFTLIKPASINTPFVEHARNELQDAHPKLMPPVYSVDIAANTILECCQTPYREITIGGSGRIMETMEKVAPRFLDRILGAFAFRQQERHDLPVRYRDNLQGPGPVEGFTEGLHKGYVAKTSLSTSIALHPVRTTLLVLGGVSLAALFSRSNQAATNFANGFQRLKTDLSTNRTTAFTENPSPS